MALHSWVAAFAVLWACTALAQPFSVRHDYAQSSDTDFGVRAFLVGTSFIVVQRGHISPGGVNRLCFTAISGNGTATDVESFGRDSLGCTAGGCNGPTSALGGDIFICGSTDDGTRVAALTWRLSSTHDSLWSVFLFPDTTDNSLGKMVRCRTGMNYSTGGVWHGSASGQVFLAKLDSMGSVAWIREYGTSVRDEGYSLDTTPDGGFILGGHTWLSATNWQGYLVKTDSAGNALWHRYLGGPYKDGWANVVCTADSEYVSVGSYATYQTDNTTNKRLYAARLNADGDVEWERQYAMASEVNELSSVTELADGTFIAPGIYYDTTSYKGVLLRFDQNGDSIWMRTYQHPPLVGVFSVHWLAHAIQTTDGGFVATGSCNDGEQDLWVLKVDSFGCLVPGCQLYDNIAEQGLELNVLAYPNPTRGKLFLSFRSAHQPTGEFILFNSAGADVQRFAPGGSSVEIDYDIGHHPAGMYLLQYQEQGRVKWSQKVIKE